MAKFIVTREYFWMPPAEIGTAQQTFEANSVEEAQALADAADDKESWGLGSEDEWDDDGTPDEIEEITD
jgi:hypothetical protein